METLPTECWSDPLHQLELQLDEVLHIDRLEAVLVVSDDPLDAVKRCCISSTGQGLWEVWEVLTGRCCHVLRAEVLHGLLAPPTHLISSCTSPA